MNPKETAPLAVLDTNTALDLLLFADRATLPLLVALDASRLRWVACPRMRDELAHVLARGLAAARGAETAPVLAAWDRRVQMLDAPVAAPATALHCSDPDDQVFIDLALACGAAWLFSRDRAVLKLARRAAPRGLHIIDPRRWPPDEKRGS